MKYLSIREFYEFLRGLYRTRQTIKQLVKKDFRQQYLGSFLGLFWAFFQPAVYICILWFIFATGFRSGISTEFPFVLYLMSGMILWFFISESFTSGANALVENSYLVKKMVFRLSILPVVKVLSSLMIHVIFLGFLLVVYFFHGYSLHIHMLQVFYYLFATLILLLGLSWLSSALNVFVKDTIQIIRVFTRLGFWFTPIFWRIEMFPPKYQFVLKLNPFYYLINGYRDSLFYKVWFWKHLRLSCYYWAIACLFFIGGAIIFRRLRSHFADVI